tara:strand:- start:10452 stop:11303 length:852 start_codon:yes stop_codon:yes gene_type:complete
MGKLQRTYRIEIGREGEDTIVITPPLTVNFTITRRYSSSLNTMQLSIKNLGKALRDVIFQDFFDDKSNKQIRFYAGYDNLSLLFEGSIFEAYSSREGVDITTHITGKDGDWDVKNTYTYQTLEKGKTVKDVLEFLSSSFTGLKQAVIGDFPEVLQRPVTLNGSTYELLKQYSDGKVFIDNNRIFALQLNEGIEGELLVVNKETGILTTPRRTAGIIQVQTLFEPRLTISQFATLESEIEPVYNGVYKILGLVHQGVISEAVGGQCITTIDFLVESKIFKTVKT